MKVLLLSTFVVVLAIYADTQSVGVQLGYGVYVLPPGAVNDVDPYCNDAPELHLPHPWDCKKFYRCVANKKIWLTCPSTLYFNARLEVCDWPGASGCIPGTGPPTDPTVPPTDPTKPPTDPTDPPTDPTDPPTDPTDPPTDPTDPPTDPTDPPTDPTDPTKPPTDPTDPTKPPTDPTDPPTDPTEPTLPTNPPSGDCPAGIDKNFHPNPADCRKYWQCIEGIRNDYTCPSGTYFNPSSINCEANNGQCNK